MPARSTLSALLLGSAAILHTACSNGGDTAAIKPPPATHIVTMEAVAFRPASIAVRVGDSIVWANKDPFPHTATAAGTFDSKDMTPEQTWSFTPSTPGRIEYVCTFHPTMKGTVEVVK